MTKRTFTVAHLVSPGGRGNNIKHIIAVPAESLDRPSIIITEDGKCWMFGGAYVHFPNTVFYIEVQPAFFPNRVMAKLSRAVPTLERAGVI
jgi:hypothetical protein